jgi:hypothetical protein
MKSNHRRSREFWSIMSVTRACSADNIELVKFGDALSQSLKKNQASIDRPTSVRLNLLTPEQVNTSLDGVVSSKRAATVAIIGEKLLESFGSSTAEEVAPVGLRQLIEVQSRNYPTLVHFVLSLADDFIGQEIRKINDCFIESGCKPPVKYTDEYCLSLGYSRLDNTKLTGRIMPFFELDNRTMSTFPQLIGLDCVKISFD